MSRRNNTWGENVLDSKDRNDQDSVLHNRPVFGSRSDSAGSGGQSSSGNYYFTQEGEFLGYDDKGEGKVYVSTRGNYEYSLGTSDDSGEVNYQSLRDNSELLKVHINEFIDQASLVYGESSAYASGMTDELKKELFALGMVYQRNKKAFGGTNDQARLFRNASPERRNNTKMQYAVAAIINALRKGEDLSYGATMWDGQEQSLYPDTEKKGWVELKTTKGTMTIELHMNTMGWDIKVEHYDAWKQNVGSKFLAPQTRVSPDNYTKGKINYNNKGKIRLYSAAVYGKTIFWIVR